VPDEGEMKTEIHK